ncbi:NhaA family Na+:H+ antiporter [Azospirillum lipoferum]|uniref:Na(+)/H(+) antiporter NhaA n=1 Tax=Azospirillum lipoferum TaxID=193 RepID=A0A5A9GTN3_AZOLI|nr:MULTISPECIES: Na+/H+ antiporter NhaA [Azospirillum]KAA0597790.1 Na+/H+ antiporter NhaA [Azospirillum lipoferum]MCP1610069.1 NhaA family Na+:H+ antiporter [Azospirillum lipoferum]MDW5534438.1 Na+/H+ antiporter NhaA [Azospirillum sp. NL1]
MTLRRLATFLKTESASGVVLMIAAVLALIWANSPAAPLYDAILAMKVVVTAGGVGLDKPLILWINDGLMAIFFLLVGLEIKREVLEGELSSPAKAMLPGIAALGGMAVPALVYCLFAQAEPGALQGWAIPAATDIAFALGVLALLGNRVPGSLRVFLLALAIMDDLGAIVIIAVFYSHGLVPLALGLAAASAVGLWLLNRAGVRSLTPYLLLGLVLWGCVLKSGIHATLAGVVLAFAVPLRVKDRDGKRAQDAPLHCLEHALHPWVAFLIMPVFALANAGVPLVGITPASLLEPVPLGIALGLFLGKQAGVFLAVWTAVKIGVVERPARASWGQVYGVAVLTGIGFTMSLFIGTLAFADPQHAVAVRLGVLTGSLASALVGYALLHTAGTVRARAAARAS